MHSARVLVVDDNAVELERCVAALSSMPEVRAEGLLRSTDALARLGNETFDLLITDLRMPVVDGLDLLRVAAAQDPDLPVLVLTGFPSVDTALSTLKAGAADYLTKPVHPDELKEAAARLLEERRIRGEHRLLERRLGHDGDEPDLVGASATMVGVLDVVRRLAASNLDILIVGETGTGKELVARRIHRQSPHASGRFVPVDCGAVPEHLLESELFGHEKGAFTGADRRSMGLLEYADGGTFFLDEVQSLPLQLQAKLLRAVQERRFRRVGAAQELRASVRVVAAVNEDPEDLMRLVACAWISTTGSTWDAWSCLLSVTGRGTSPCWPATSWGASGGRGAGSRGSRARPWACWRPTLGPATCANSRTCFAGAWRWPRGRCCAPTTFPTKRAAAASGIARATFYRLLNKHAVDPDRFRAP